MLRENIVSTLKLNRTTSQILVGCGIGFILGNAFLRFSPLLVLGALAAVIGIYAIVKWPELGLLGILIATSSIVFEDQLPIVTAGGISLHIPDLILLTLLGLIVLRRLVEPDFNLVHTPLDYPLVIFWGVTLLTTIIATSMSSVDAVEARRAARVLLYYLTFFIVTNLIRDRRQLNLLINGLFLLASVVAAAMVMQFLLGDSVRLLPGRIENLNTQGLIYEDITRILPPGWSIVLVSFIAIICILVLEKFKPVGWLIFLQCGLLGMALLVTFLRSYWIVLIIIFSLLFILFRGIERQRLIGWSLVSVLVTVIALLFFYSSPNSQAMKLVDATIARLNTLSNSGTFRGQDSSLNWRKIENSYAIQQIISHPWTGLGMSARYRPWDPRLDRRGTGSSGYDFRRHIHNGHLRILLDSGLLGYLSLMWLSLAFLLRGFRYWRHVSDKRMRGIVLGFTLVYLGVLIAAMANSSFTQWRWTPVIGIIMGINEVILMKFNREELAV